MSSLHQLKHDNYPLGFSEFILDLPRICWWEKGNFWLIRDYQLAQEALLHPKLSCDRSPFFISRMPNVNLNLLCDFFGIVKNMMVMADNHDHYQKHRICFHGINQQFINTLKPIIERAVDTLLSQVPSQFDFVNDIAKPLPCLTLSSLFEIPEQDQAQFYQWSETMTYFFGGAAEYSNQTAIEVNNAAIKLHQYFQEKLSAPTKKDSFLNILSHLKDKYQLNQDQLISQCIMMLVAGQVTTSDQAAHILFTLIEHKVELNTLTENNLLLEKAIDEAIRLDPAVTFLFRTAKIDLELDGQTINKGQTVFISTHACNRNPNTYSSPHQFNMYRDAKPHLSFGFGPHYCLGAKVAKIKLMCLFKELFKRYPKLEITGAKRNHQSLAFSGFDSLALST